MNSDLERLIALQRLDSAADAARRRLADEPERQKALETRLESARQRVTHAKEQFTANQAARREIDKEVAVHQGRLSKYREQAMAVKTNIEYHAIQKEIGHAQGEIKTHEDRMLERMLEADDLTAAVKKAEADLAAEQKAVDGDRKAMTAEHTELQASLAQIAVERAGIVAALDQQTLAISSSSRNDATASRSRRHATASARSVTSACARRCSTTFAGTKRSSSATAATGSSTSWRRRPPRRKTRNR
jgi:predicted  nucleic acid-binding Zn-ribbon protein